MEIAIAGYNNYFQTICVFYFVIAQLKRYENYYIIHKFIYSFDGRKD